MRGAFDLEKHTRLDSLEGAESRNSNGLLTAEYFGTKNLGANYGLVFTGYGAGGVLGPMLAGGVWDLLHSYRWAFVSASVGCLLAMLLAMTVRPPQIEE